MSEEIGQKLIELRGEHLVIASKMKCLQEMNSLYYDLRNWLNEKILSSQETQTVRDDCVFPNVEKLNSYIPYEECLKIRDEIKNEHSRLRDLARERKYK